MKKLTNSTMLTSHNGTIIMDVGASWCNPCRKLEPLLHKEEQRHPDITFITANVDDATLAPILSQFHIMSVPTVLKLHQGRVISSHTGGMTATQLKTFIDA